MLKAVIKTFIVIFLFLPAALPAADFSIMVKSTAGKAVKDSVVTLTPVKKIKKLPVTTYIIDQINKTYVPHVKIITVGSNISFPNKDNIRHHVYSFSEARKFELPLYEGTPANPVSFDKKGIVTLGCNIHDWMRAYIFITDTPYYALTANSGKAEIKNIPKGKYRIQTWHPRLKQETKEKIINIKGDMTEQAILALKPSFKIRRAPKAKRRRY